MDDIRKIFDGNDSDVILVSLQEHFTLRSNILKVLSKVLPEHKVLSTSRALGLWSMVLSKKSYDVQTMRIGLGPFGFPNKGACITKIASELVFVSCHLTAHVENNDVRLSQILKIFECTCDEETVRDVKTVIIAGDMNFRVASTKCHATYSAARQFDQCNDFKKMYPVFREGTVRFGPSYKYVNNTNTLSKSRQPAWCDRIFVSSVYNVTFRRYSSIEDVILSDHKPVMSVFKITSKRSESAALPDVKYRSNRILHGFTWLCCFLYECSEVILGCCIVLALLLLFVRLKLLSR